MKSKRELHGSATIEYAKRLKKVRTNADAWEIEYLDEEAGEKRIMDYPESELHGAGSPRLRHRD